MLTLIPLLCLMFAAQENILHRAPVEYPRAAWVKGIQGSVVVEVNVDEDGLVSDARALSGPPELRAAALRSVLDWHFSKQMQLPGVTQVTVDFKLPDRLPAATLTAKPAAYKAHISQQPVLRINIQGLSEPARDTLLKRLPIRGGDTIDSDLFERVTGEVQAFDDHLRVILLHQPGGVMVDIAPRPAQRVLSTAAQPGPIPVGGNAQQAKLVRKVMPVYPSEAKAAGIQGVVKMSAVIGREGEVKSLEVLTGPPDLVPAALDAVRQWVYEPTRLNGESVEVKTQIDVNFTLAK